MNIPSKPAALVAQQPKTLLSLKLVEHACHKTPEAPMAECECHLRPDAPVVPQEIAQPAPGFETEVGIAATPVNADAMTIARRDLIRGEEYSGAGNHVRLPLIAKRDTDVSSEA